MQEKILAYAAGIIDGEGSICLSRQRSTENRSPCVTVTSTDYELIQWMIDNFGGHVSKKPPKQENHSFAWKWELKFKNAIHFLTLISPYLVIKCKKERARMVCEEYSIVTPKNGKYSLKLKQAKLAFEERFSKLK